MKILQTLNQYTSWTYKRCTSTHHELTNVQPEHIKILQTLNQHTLYSNKP